MAFHSLRNACVQHMVPFHAKPTTKVLGRSDWLLRHPYGFAKVFSLMVKVVAMWFLGCSEQCLSVLRWLLELCCVVVKWPKRGHSIQNKKQKQHKQTKPKTKKNISNKTPGKPTNKSTEPKITKQHVSSF